MERFALLLAPLVALVVLWWVPGTSPSDPLRSGSDPDVPGLINLGVYHLMEDFAYQALKNFEAPSHGSLEPLATALAGIARSRLGDLEGALSCYEAADRAAGKEFVPPPLKAFASEGERFQEPDWSTLTGISPGRSCYLLGVWLAGSDRVQPGLEALEAADRVAFEPRLTLAALSAARLRSDRWAEAAAPARAIEQKGDLVMSGLLLAAFRIKDQRCYEALSSLEGTGASGPARGASLHLEGLAMTRLDRTAGGEAAWYRALAMDAEYTPVHMALARFYTEQGRYAAAERHLEQALAYREARIPGLITRADLADRSGNREEARRRWQQVLQLDAGRHEVRRRLGLSYLEEENYAQALPLLDRVLRENGEDIALLFAILRAAEGLERQNKTVEILRRLDRLKPYSREIQVRLAAHLVQLGQPEKARAYLEEAIEKNRLSPSGYLYYMEWTLEVEAEGTVTRLRRLVWKLLRHHATTVDDVVRAEDLLLNAQIPPGPDWRNPLLATLAGKILLLSDGAAPAALDRLARYLENMGNPEESQRILRHLVEKCSKNRHLKELMERFRK